MMKSEELTVVQLKEQLEKVGLGTGGAKAELQLRLCEALEANGIYVEEHEFLDEEPDTNNEIMAIMNLMMQKLEKNSEEQAHSLRKLDKKLEQQFSEITQTLGQNFVELKMELQQVQIKCSRRKERTRMSECPGLKRVKLQAPTFDGSYTFEVFKLKFEIAAATNNWNIGEKTESLIVALKGSAEEFLKQIPPEQHKNYQAVMDTLERKQSIMPKMNRTPPNVPAGVSVPTGCGAKRMLKETSPEQQESMVVKNSVGNMQLSDLMSVLSNLLDDKLQNVATKKDLEDIKAKMGNINHKVENLAKENSELKKELEKLKREREHEQLEIDRLISQSKRKNVIFKGFEKANSPKKAVEMVCNHILKLPEVKIASARIIYTRNERISVVAEMGAEDMATEVFKSVKNLSGHKITIERDLDKKRLECKKALLQLKADILNVDQTHVNENKAESLSKYFGGYNLTWKYATRINNYGRYSGGILLAIKKELANLRINCYTKIIQECHVIYIKFGHTQINIVPLYIRSAIWSDEFSKLETIFMENEIKNLIVIGDLNVRIGKMQNYLEEEYIANFTAGFEERKSKDEVENSRGHRFIHLCCDNGLVIPNGMTKGDEEGEITFCSGVGMSVNDICAVSLEILEFIDKFEVGNTHWSDHFPIVLTLRLTDIETVRKNTNLLPKLKWNKQQVTAYKQRISETLLNVKQNKDLLTLTDITYVIKSAHKETQIREHSFEKKQNWFNWRCHKARQETFKSLEKFRQVSSSQNKEFYLKDNKHYKVICAEAKQRYYQQLDAKIQNVKTNKDWWKIAREINGNTSSTITMEAEMLKLYFSNLLNPSRTSLDIQYAHGYMEVYELDKTITLREVKEFVERTKNYKAPGEDRIPYEFIKYASDDLLSEITIACNDMFNSGIVDESFVKSIIYPIHKKGHVGLPCNYRGVSFMNCIAKIMMGVVTDRLTNWTENFKAAFDKVSRKALIYKLHAAGVSTKMVRFIENVYSNTKCAVWTGKDLSNEFSAVSGVKQGCILSPHLFVLYLNDLHDFLGGGIQIEELNIRTLMYADDIVILADDITTLQKMIYKLESYCHSWNLEINLSPQLWFFEKEVDWQIKKNGISVEKK
ncbi:uncharacterized protein LOC119690188 [Teleopsis dalmanni]|uniref:uncharacterized protein LOC119690188 n=1 Tax=Teleopsis dalmanni TaxID=139649 RepID=UPI0018CDD777|nr:uncharacterized protein LOC119690188 [Teleopsis dalmanni]